MLDDTEPVGGEPTGSTPAGDPAEGTSTANPARAADPAAGTDPADAASAAPARRVRATRRRAADPEPPAEGEAAPVKATRTRRKKAAEPLEAGASGDSPQTSPDAAAPQLAAAPPAGPSSDAAAEPAPPVKATRTRRKKAAAPAPEVEIATAAEPAPEVADAAAEEEDEVEAAEAAAIAAGTRPAGAADPARPTELTPRADEAETQEPRRRRRGAALPPTVLFMAPEPGDEPVPPARRSRAAAAEAAPAAPAAEAPAAVEAAVEETEPAETGRRRRRGRRTPAGSETVAAAEEAADSSAAEAEEAEAEEADEFDEDDESAAARRRRRRGRRGRGRGKGGADDEDDAEPAAADAEAEEEEPADEADEDGEPLTRRRRRRRRKGAADTDSADDGVPTVVKIREPRRPSDEVQGVSGSTRLEAKRQRRRDGREQRRTRPPILTESEFLARREAVDRVMVVRQRGDRTQIAVLEDGVLVEHYVTRLSNGTMAGNVYLGKVQNVLPSMEAAFVDVGRGRNAVLYAGEVNWDASGLEGRSRSIEHALRSGDSVLVQVTKDPIGHKGARLTSHIALSGRHLVYVPNGNASGISRKLSDTERKRLRDVLKKLVPDGAGVIVRTAAEGASEDELARDVKRLQAQWEDIQAKAAHGGAPALLSEEPDLVIRVVRDLFNEDFRELVVQGEESYEMVESYLAHVSPDLIDRLHRYTGGGDVFAQLRIDEQILKGLDRKVFLPSGGHLVIDRTEAMTVVDVNTGKYTGAGGNLEETVTRNNLEAAEEIVRQLRLRDLGGIVVIDFIDMVLESNRDLVLRRLTECLGRDRTKHQVTEITSLGLVQMTRKRIGAGLLEAFSETCDCCKGRGLIIHTEPVSDKPKQQQGAADKVKAVASAGSQPAPAQTAPARNESNGRGESNGESSGRRRGRRSGGPAEPAATPATPAVVDEDDTMGYDLSRYEVEPDPVEPVAADVADEPAEGEGPESDEDGDDDGLSAVSGRRRSRRGGTRRRTRP